MGGVNNKAKNVILAPKHYLNLFKISLNDDKNDQNLWHCNETGLIYEYFEEDKMWLTVSDSLLFDYYFHKKIKQNETLKLNKNVKLIAFNDHFSKYVIGNKLVLRKKWISLHPKLKNLLIDD